MRINANTFFCQLPQVKQNEIKDMLRKKLESEECYSVDEIEAQIESASENRLWVIEEVLDISQFFD